MSDSNKPAYLVVCGTTLGGAADPRYGELAAPAAEKANLTMIAFGEMGSEKGRGVRCKYYCKTCKDPSGVRFLNFHVDCFNRWHGDEECLQCQ